MMIQVNFFAGGWWTVKKFSQISGNICIEIGDNRYMFAEDNGRFTLGPTRESGIIFIWLRDRIFLFHKVPQILYVKFHCV